MDCEDKSEYFTSYEDLTIHKLMLEDEPRTLAYKNAIFNNKSYFQDKIVMDVGCGTGILSLFAAQAGAKKVYAVEASEIANIASEVVRENHMENIIEVIHSRVEDISLPSETKVDVIVSEWMGFYLLHEGMLDSVLFARDKFLKKDGHLFPESATIYAAPCSLPSLYEKWKEVYGVQMESFAKHLRALYSSKPEIQPVHTADLLGEEIALSWINLKEDTIEDLNSFSIEHVVGSKKKGQFQGMCIWFNCVFPNLIEEGEPVMLDTSPAHVLTHWKQTVIVLPDEQPVEIGDPIAFKLDLTRDAQNKRRYNLQLTLLDPDIVEHPTPCTCNTTKCIVIKTFMQTYPERFANGAGDSNSEDENEYNS